MNRTKVEIKGKKILIRDIGGLATAAGVIRDREMDTEDKAIQDALKRLGWMSPEDAAVVWSGFELLYPPDPRPFATYCKYYKPFPVRAAARKFDEYDLLLARQSIGKNSPSTRVRNMSLAELLTEAEAAARQGATSPLYEEILTRLRRVAGVMERIDEPR